jgi:hypothetical protein
MNRILWDESRRLVVELQSHFAEPAKLEDAIKMNLNGAANGG